MFNEKADFYKIYCGTELIDIKYEMNEVVDSVSTLFRKKNFPLVVGYNKELDMDFVVCFILNEKKLNDFIKKVSENNVSERVEKVYRR